MFSHQFNKRQRPNKLHHVPVKQKNLNRHSGVAKERKVIGEYEQPVAKQKEFDRFFLLLTRSQPGSVSSFWSMFEKLSLTKKLILIAGVLLVITAVADAAKTTKRRIARPPRSTRPQYATIEPITRENCSLIPMSHTKDTVLLECEVPQRRNEKYRFMEYGRGFDVYNAYDCDILIEEIMRLRRRKLSLFAVQSNIYPVYKVEPDFTPAKDFSDSTADQLHSQRVQYTEEIRQKYGDKAIVEFTIAKMLIYDPYNENMGFDAKGFGITHSYTMPAKRRNYIEHAVDVINSPSFPFILTYQHLDAMRYRCNHMMTMGPLPSPESKFLLSQHQELVAFLLLCRNACHSIVKEKDKTKSSPNLNEKLIQFIEPYLGETERFTGPAMLTYRA